MNDTISAAVLKSLKKHGMGPGVDAVYKYLQNPSRLNLTLNVRGLSIGMFRFPYGAFDDTNNLSLITSIQYGNFCILFPGDLEDEGWRRALLNEQFRYLLGRVNVFVTSHHGRDSGCCPEVFEGGICSPDAFIVSDKELVHETQETTAWYGQHAKGLHKILENPWDVPETRYVFTTRTDACISIDISPDGRFILYPNSRVQRNVEPKRFPAPAPDWSSLLIASLAGGSKQSR